MKITDEMIKAVKAELLAHGEFGSSSTASEQNAEIAAKSVLNLVLSASPAGVGVETDKMRQALELLIRCGEKQGWNDAYEQEMVFARAALTKEGEQ